MRELDALEEAQIELAHDVLASPEAGHLTGHDDLDHEIATSWRRWHEPSAAATRFAGVPPTVEIALDQTLPVMLSGEPDEYARVPTVLRAFIRYAPAEREVSPTLTLETLEVVDRFEGAFLDKRDSPEVVAARAELAAAFEEIAARSERSWVEQRLLDALGLRVRRPTYVKRALIEDRTATRDLKALVDSGLLNALGNTRGRFYVASGELAAIRESSRQARRRVDDPYPWLMDRIRSVADSIEHP